MLDVGTAGYLVILRMAGYDDVRKGWSTGGSTVAGFACWFFGSVGEFGDLGVSVDCGG